MQIAGTWDDTTADVQAAQATVSTEYGTWNGDLDVTVGGLAENSDETWAQAAQGAYTTRWTQTIDALKTARAGKPGTTYVRFAHEMNGDWYPWKVAPGDVADFKTSWRLFYGILKQEFPAAQMVFGANSGTSADNASINQIWPGDDVVDVVGVDLYCDTPFDQTSWDAHLNDVGADGSPTGLGAWLAFATAHGKPLAIPEWGLNPSAGATDQPGFITAMHDFMAANAATPGSSDAGRVIYDIYFNTGGAGFQIDSGQNAQSAATYRTLSWGSQVIPTPSATPAPQTAVSAQPPVPAPGTSASAPSTPIITTPPMVKSSGS